MIEINRNNNKIIIKPDYEKQNISLTINEKLIDRDGTLNSKNQFMAPLKKTGVQLDEEQAHQIRLWKDDFNRINFENDIGKEKQIKDKICEKISFKYHNYLTQKYVSCEDHITLSNGDRVYSDDFKDIRSQILNLTDEDRREIGIKTEDDIWQDVKITVQVREFLVSCNWKHSQEAKKKAEETKSKNDKQKKEEEAKFSEILSLAKETGEKQVLKTSSCIADDGNLVISTTYILPDGKEKTSYFHDGD